ncbi:MAG: MFS transporter [Burkholderiaceae bacterium]|nr:MAG: MFS transporter [Burkholderiaceae bacterium]TAM07047.1 MAG: MFS transporter [Pusillimonas sp.]
MQQPRNTTAVSPATDDALPPTDDTPSGTASSSAAGKAVSSVARPIVLFFAIVYVATNLRPALLGVGPLLGSLQKDLGLSSVASGVLITLPVLCFGVFAPFSPKLLRYTSAERLILLNLILLVLGLALRSVLGLFGLFAGTFVIGFSISVVMVLLPSIIKHHFSARAGTMMGLYSTALALGATIAAGVTVPLEQWLGGWTLALGFWLVPALIAVFVWWPYAQEGGHERGRARPALPKLRHSWLAWQVTLFMGFQGAIAYSLFGWLPLILIDHGLSTLEGGLVLSATMLVQVPSSMVGPWLAGRIRSQSLAILLMLLLVLVGYLSMVYAPVRWIYVWSTVFGVGFGGMFSLSMALLVWRSPTVLIAASLSGMAQGVGYTLAAVAPLVMGILHGATGDWNAASLFMVLLIIGAAWSGGLAGREKFIEADAAP